MVENDINQIFKVEEERVSNLNELLALMREYQDLCDKYKNLSKLEKNLVKYKMADMEVKLRRGIKIDNAIILQYIENIEKFVQFLGINYDSISSRLSSIELVISPVSLLEKGKLCNYGSFIAIDCEYINCDEKGNFLDLKEPMPGFFKHTIIHELLHAISNKGMNYMDSFSEGMTEYFAHKISKNTNVISNSYRYIESVFYMFGSLMGDDLLFEDYVTNIYEMKNLHIFIESLGISREEFKNFKNDLDSFLEKHFEKRDNDEELVALKNKIDYFVFNRIIMPYCSYDKENAIKMMKRFFSNSEETKLDLCELHLNCSDKKTKG